MAKMESGSGHAERAQGASDAGRAQGASDSDTGLIALLIQINKALHRRTSEELLGMRLKQFLLLGYVGDRGAVSQQELETGLVMDANSVVLLLNETEATGWSVRKRDPADRRRHMVELTEAGKQAGRAGREGARRHRGRGAVGPERGGAEGAQKAAEEGPGRSSTRSRRIPLAGVARRSVSRRSPRTPAWGSRQRSRSASPTPDRSGSSGS